MNMNWYKRTNDYNFSVILIVGIFQLFEDAAYADGFSPPLFVPQRYVITYKPTKKGGSTSSWQENTSVEDVDMEEEFLDDDEDDDEGDDDGDDDDEDEEDDDVDDDDDEE